jgi:hypothetical protein
MKTTWLLTASLLLTISFVPAGENGKPSEAKKPNSLAGTLVIGPGSRVRAYTAWRTPVVRGKDGKLSPATRCGTWRSTRVKTPPAKAGWQRPEFDDRHWSRGGIPRTAHPGRYPNVNLRCMRHNYGLSIVALGLLILGAMASVSGDFKELVRTKPMLALGLFAFMCGFSALLHVVGYFLAPWRPTEDRAALSVNTAYVNNGLAIVFAVEFFKAIPELGTNAVLPAILLEAPMAIALVPLKAYVVRKARAEATAVAQCGD